MAQDRMDALGHDLPDEVKQLISKFDQHPTATLIKSLLFERYNDWGSAELFVSFVSESIPGQWFLKQNSPDHDGWCQNEVLVFQTRDWAHDDLYILEDGDRGNDHSLASLMFRDRHIIDTGDTG